MMVTHSEANTIRRIHRISRPKSAFTRLFSEKHRQQEEFINKPRPESNNNKHQISIACTVKENQIIINIQVLIRFQLHAQ